MSLPTHDFVVRFKNIPEGAEGDLRFAFEGADLLVVCESHLRDSARYAPEGWGTVQFGSSDGARGTHGRVTIYWRKARFRLVSSSNPLMNEANGLHFPGAKRYATQGTFLDLLTGWYWDLEGDHFVPHADLDKRSGVITTMPRGRLAVTPAIKSLVTRLKRSRRGQKIRVGDLNVDLSNDLRIRDNGMIEQFNRAGLYDVSQLLGTRVPDTHGNQTYDWIMVDLVGSRRTWVKPNPRAWVIASGVGPKRKSDHRDRFFRVRTRARRGWKVPAGAGPR